MRNVRFEAWATLYGVAFAYHRLGWFEWAASMKRGRTVVPVTVYSFTRPTPYRAFHQLRQHAREAALCGSFEGWLSRQPPGRSMAHYEREWEVREGARGRLLSLVGQEGTRRLLWSVRDAP